MRTLYDENNLVIGYSFYDGFVTTAFDTSWAITSIAINVDAEWDSIALQDDGSTQYSYTDSYGDSYTYNVVASVLDSYTVAYSYSDYVYTYDALGELTSYSYSDGVKTTVYNPDGTVLETTADVSQFDAMTPVYADDQQTVVGYQTETDPFGSYTVYYVDAGNITAYDNVDTYTDSSGEVWTYVYSYTVGESADVFAGASISDGTTTSLYDADWNLVSSTADTSGLVEVLEDGVVVGYSSTNEWGETTLFDTEGVVTGYQYSYTYDNGESYVYDYSADWEFVSSTYTGVDGNTETTTYTYDSETGLYLGSETVDASGVVLRSETYSYTADGLFSGYEYFDGTTTSVYDENWNFVGSEFSFDSLTDEGNGTYSSTDDWGTTTFYENIEGTIVVIGYQYEWTDTFNGYVYTSDYDANWNYLGSVTLDASGSVVYSDTYFYDEQGNFEGYTYFDGVTTWTYDADWNLTSSAADVTGLDEVLDSDGTTVIGYESTDEWGTTTTYDKSGNVTGHHYEWTDTYSGNVYTSDYDANWNYLGSETLDSEGNLLYSDSYYYDEQGAFTGYSYFDGVTTWSYDENYNLIGSETDQSSLTLEADGTYSFTDEWGTTTHYGDVDGQGTLEVIGYSSEWVDTYNGHVYTSEYDANWNYIGSETRDAAGNLLYSDTYIYDDAGDFAGYTYFDGVTTTTYDANWNVESSAADVGTLDQVTDDQDQVIGYESTDEWGTTTEYDLNGAVTGYHTEWVDTFDGSRYEYDYDANWNYLGSATYDANGVLLYSDSYLYNADGSYAGYTYFDGVTTWTYDANWELLGSETDTADMESYVGDDGQTYFKDEDEWGNSTVYDESGAIVGYENTWISDSQWDAGTVYTVTYDANWNIITDIAVDATGEVIWEYSYSYDEFGAFAGYTYFDGVTTYEYNANYEQVGSTVDTGALTPILDETGTTIGYSATDDWGNTTLFDLEGVVVGYENEWINDYDGSRTVSNFDENYNYVGSVTYSVSGAVIYSDTTLFDEAGNIVGYENFDGTTTYEYDINWNLVGSNVDTSDLETQVGADGTTYYLYTDEWGTTTIYTDEGQIYGYRTEYVSQDQWDLGTTYVTSYGPNWEYQGSRTYDASGTLVSEEVYLYDSNGNFQGYTFFDGAVTWEYDANYNLVSSTADTSVMTERYDDSGNLIGYISAENEWGEATLFDLDSVVVGYQNSYSDEYGSSVSYYDQNWVYLGYEYTDASGTVLFSEEWSYDSNGSFTGAIVFDGVSTREYDANWNLIGEEVDLGQLTEIYDQSGTTIIGYSFTDEWGSKTLYDTDLNITGYQDEWIDDYEGFTYITSYDANWMYTGSQTLDPNGNIVWSEIWNYDEFGNFTGAIVNEYGTTYEYDANWNLVGESAPMWEIVPDTTQGDGIIGTFVTEEGNEGTLFGDESTGLVTKVEVSGYDSYYGEYWTETYNIEVNSDGTTFTSYEVFDVEFSGIDSSGRPAEALIDGVPYAIQYLATPDTNGLVATVNFSDTDGYTTFDVLIEMFDANADGTPESITVSADGEVVEELDITAYSTSGMTIQVTWSDDPYAIRTGKLVTDEFGTEFVALDPVNETGVGTTDDFTSDQSTSGFVEVDGSAVSGTIETSGDEDWFAVDFVAGNTYTIDLKAAGSGVGTLSDTYLSLYDNSGSELAWNDDGGFGFEDQLVFTATASGLYYVGASGLGDTGTYQVSVTSGDNSYVQGFQIIPDTVDGDGIIGSFTTDYNEQGTIYGDEETGVANGVTISGVDYDGFEYSMDFRIVMNADGTTFISYEIFDLQFDGQLDSLGRPTTVFIDGTSSTITYDENGNGSAIFNDAGELLQVGFYDDGAYSGTAGDGVPDKVVVNSDGTVIETHKVTDYDATFGMSIQVVESTDPYMIRTGSIVTDEVGTQYIELDAVDSYNGELDLFEGTSEGDTINLSGMYSEGSVGGEVWGWDGNDTITGSDGDDLLWGDTGADVLTGGLGFDTFAFYDDDMPAYDWLDIDENMEPTPGDVIDFIGGADVITDFSLDDEIVLESIGDIDLTDIMPFNGEYDAANGTFTFAANGADVFIGDGVDVGIVLENIDAINLDYFGNTIYLIS